MVTAFEIVLSLVLESSEQGFGDWYFTVTGSQVLMLILLN